MFGNIPFSDFLFRTPGRAAAPFRAASASVDFGIEIDFLIKPTLPIISDKNNKKNKKKKKNNNNRQTVKNRHF